MLDIDKVIKEDKYLSRIPFIQVNESIYSTLMFRGEDKIVYVIHLDTGGAKIMISSLNYTKDISYMPEYPEVDIKIELYDIFKPEILEILQTE